MPPLQPAPPPVFVEHHLQASSTQDLARARPQAAHGDTFVARHQLRGRGRQGRSWTSGAHAGVWMTTVLYVDASGQLSTLSLVAGLSVRRALADFGHVTALKWPNDLLLAGGKVAGVLVEAELVGDRARLMVGIGVNLGRPPVGADWRGLPPAALVPDLAAADPAATEALRRALAAAVATHLVADCATWQEHGWAAFAGAFAAVDALDGQWVEGAGPGRGTAAGRARGVDAGGRLLVDTADGRQAFAAGEVRWRPPGTPALPPGGGRETGRRRGPVLD